MRGDKTALRRLWFAEQMFVRLLPRKAHRGETKFGRLGDVAQQPPIWIGLAAVLGVAGGPRGRRAAARGSLCYGVTAIVVNLIKPLVRRERPPGAGEGRTGPITSSFPSGHAATDLAFTLGVAQEIPVLFIPLAVATSAGHWSIIRSRGHYPSDVFVGGCIGVAVAAALWVIRPPQGSRPSDETSGATADARPGAGRSLASRWDRRRRRA